MMQLLYKYGVYIVYFLGIGMTSSGIVLMPFNLVRYSIILCIGLGLFSAGSIFNEVVIDKHNLNLRQSIRLVVLSLSLAIGIGMISGGIAHFIESPVYVSYLIPLGIIISFFSFMLKNKYVLLKKEKIIVFSAILILAILIHFGLGYSASEMIQTGMQAGGDIFKSNH